ncbi:MAG: hypothetical protein HFH85_11705 [Lachnospiraceae bacterium]|jgi:aspartokinase|nr:hypothetical protein [Lachnospiraceae bacterium]
MENRIQKITAFRITIERRKLARDKKSIQIIFEVLEECKIPCECMAINIDWLAIVIRKSERGKASRFIELLEERLSQIDISIEGDIVLLYLENGKMTSRRIGMIISSLSIQGIDIVMQRYLTCEDRLVIGIAPEDADQSIGIIREIVDGGYHT